MQPRADPDAPARTGCRPGPASVLLVAAGLSGCSVFSPAPLWELTKATGAVVAGALSETEPSAPELAQAATRPPPPELCIAHDGGLLAHALVPAAQVALHARGVSTRLVAAGERPAGCQDWLSLQGRTEWAPGLWSNRPSLQVLDLHLQWLDAQGRVQAWARADSEPAALLGTRASPRQQLSPLIAALWPLPPDPAGELRSTPRPQASTQARPEPGEAHAPSIPY